MLVVNPILEQDLSYATNYFKDKNQDEMVIKPLNSIGVYLEGLKVVFNSENPRPGDVFHGVRQLLSKYNINGKEYELNFLTDESDGTIKFYTYLALVEHIIQTNALLVIDEIETHFHPLRILISIKCVKTLSYATKNWGVMIIIGLMMTLIHIVKYLS